MLYLLAGGAILVNAGLLPETPHEFVRGLAELGILLIMFAIGFDERIEHFLANVRRSWGIALFGALGPFAVTYLVVWWYWQDDLVALVCGLAMASTAVSLSLVALRSEGLGRSVVATRIMTSAVLDHIGSLVLVAIVIPIALSADQGLPSAGQLLLILFKASCFFGLVTLLGAVVFPHHRLHHGSHGAEQKKWWPSLRGLLQFQNGEYATLVVLLLALVIGLLAHGFGFHPAIGAYMAGLLLKEEYFADDDNRPLYAEVQRTVNNVAFAWIGPVFFVLLGSKLVFDWQIFIAVIVQTMSLTAAIMLAQVGCAYVAARYIGTLPHAASLMVGFGMLGRAELAFVVMDIAYVQHQLISEAVFYTLMFTAFWLNVSVPIAIRWWKPRYLAAELKAQHV